MRTTHVHALPVCDADQRAAELERAIPGMHADAASEDRGEDGGLDGLAADELTVACLTGAAVA